MTQVEESGSVDIAVLAPQGSGGSGGWRIFSGRRFRSLSVAMVSCADSGRMSCLKLAHVVRSGAPQGGVDVKETAIQ